MTRLFIILVFLGFSVPGFSQSNADTTAVYFDTDRFALTQQSIETLESILNRPDEISSIHLYGHCDSRASDEYNLRLAANRAESVRRFLVSKGIAVTKIRSEALGEQQPAGDNSTDAGRAHNRRVDVIIVTEGNEATGKTEPGLIEKLADTTLVGTSLTLRNIHFEGGRSLILPQSEPALQELLQAMQKFPKLEIRIEGHICCQYGPADGLDMGTGYYNLSEARAKAIMEYLLRNGVERNRLSFQGFGHSRPIHPYPEETEEQRTENRRVEVRILKM
jgi:outer membrane protein OmpA-like peptidoglycan-associated protein